MYRGLVLIDNSILLSSVGVTICEILAIEMGHPQPRLGIYIRDRWYTSKVQRLDGGRSIHLGLRYSLYIRET